MKKKLIYVMILSMMILGNGQSMISAATKRPETPTNFMATGVKNQVVLSWVNGKRTTGVHIYLYNTKSKKYEKIAETKKAKYILKNGVRGAEYSFKVRAYRTYKGKKYYSGYTKRAKTALAAKGESTIKNFLKTAMAPMGTTMYIWGGGWNKADTGAGKDAKRIGVNGNWYKFFKKQGAGYNYKKYRYKWGSGLDCSGFVGWAVYNIRNTTGGKTGYVTKAKNQGKLFAKKGWGSYKTKSKVTDYKAGDIMTSNGHVYIVVGSCPDKSVVLVHSSPNGVRISGTASPKGKKNSQAVKLAKKYMKKYRPAWYKKYPSCYKNKSYLSDYGQMRWDISGNKMMADDENYWKHNAQWILNDLFTN